MEPFELPDMLKKKKIKEQLQTNDPSNIYFVRRNDKTLPRLAAVGTKNIL